MSDTTPTLTTFTAGDIVVSVVGGQDAIQTGVSLDNAASPITLEEINPLTGSIVGTLTLPQTSTMVNGTLENAISGEYGSSSEGSLELAGNGQSLVIAGYGVNATTFNEGGPSVYGTAALAQSLTIEPNAGTYTLVPRVVADIGYNGTVDTSTALLDVFNGQNPRSVATVNGRTFYLAGQGEKNSTNQGVFVAGDGATAATAINTSTDTRDAEIYNGTLYVSVDTKTGPTDGIESYGTLPSGATGYTLLPGITGQINLTAAQVNTVNAADVGQSVNLSPENFFFANDTTLYIADGGNPKEGGLGDGGLQKWTLNTITNTWVLDYTLSKGLNITPDTGTTGTSGLIGLTGTENANGTVTFFATTEGLADLDQTYLVTITDTLANTIAPSNETFTTLVTAAPNTNVRGVAEAPSAPASSTISTPTTGSVVSNGSTITVAAGGTASAFVVNSGGALYINSGGTDTGSLILLGGTEYVAGAASGDAVYGTVAVSGAGAAVTSETVEYGGTLVVGSGGVASATTLMTSGTVAVSGGTLTGPIVFSGGGDIAEMVANASAGIATVISNFAGTDEIDFTFLPTATLTSATSGGNTVITVTSGGISENITFAGQYEPGEFKLSGDGAGGEKLVIANTTLASNLTVSSGFVAANVSAASGTTLIVNSGGTAISATVQSGGTMNVLGTDLYTTISSGGLENILGGTAFGDTILGTQSATGGNVTSDTIANGGTVVLNNTSSTEAGFVVQSGGQLFIEAYANVTGAVIAGGTIVLGSKKSEISGGLTFNGAGTVVISSVSSPSTASATYGDVAVVSGFGLNDVISVTSSLIGNSATLKQTSAGGNTIETVSGTGGSESFTFAGTGYGTSYFELLSSSAGDIIAETGYTPANPNLTTIPAGASSTNFVVSSGHTLSVLSGGIATGTTVLLGGTALFAGTDSGAVESAGGSVTIASTGIETGAIIKNGGTELVLGSASLDMISGTQIVSAATAVVTAETVFNGGTLDLFTAGAVASNTVLSNGGSLVISGRATAVSTMIDGGTIVLESPKAVLGNVTFNGPGLIEQTAVGSGSVPGTLYGFTGVISGFEIGDTIVLDSIAAFVDPGVGLVISGGTVDTMIAIAGITAASDLQITSSGGFTTIASLLDVISAGPTFTAGTLASGDSYTFEPGATAAGTISFTGTDTTLEFAGTPLTNTIENFTFTDTIDLAGLTYSAGHVSDTYNSTTGLLTITSGAMSETLSLGNFPAADAADFQFSQDYSGGTDLMLCFYPGTRIATPHGDVTVETLSPGDMVLTENGPLPIRWIGTSQASTRFADPLRVLPIRIRAGALGLGLPLRDLLLSPDHAIFLDGILVQAGALVNGTTIIRERNVPETFTYYHVELATHELLLAEGVPAETFVDNVDRMAFSNWDDRAAPAEAILEMDLPRAKSARQLPRSLRDRLAPPIAA